MFLKSEADDIFMILPYMQLKSYRSMGLVMAVKADKVFAFRQELHSMINEP